MVAFLEMTGRQLPQLVTLFVAFLGLAGLLFAGWASGWSKLVLLISGGGYTVFAVNVAFYVYILFLRQPGSLILSVDFSAIRSLVNVLSLLPYVGILVIITWRQRQRKI